MLHALDAALARWPAGSMSFVLHVGAGSGEVLPLYAALKPLQVLLVEGDPLHGDALRVAAAEFPFADVLVRAVSPAGGELQWHRTTLPGLDGPLDMQGLRTYYPRLRLLETFPQASVAVTGLAAQRPHAGSGAALLVLEVPGQEDALLAALGPRALQEFDACILCGCNAAGGVTPAPQAVRRLQAGGATVSWSNAEREPLWPVTALLTPRGQVRQVGVAPTSIRREHEASADGAAQRAELGRLRDENEMLRARLRDAEAAAAAQQHELRQLAAAQDRERERHDALQQQLTDAEAQIALLKDLLLRESQP